MDNLPIAARNVQENPLGQNLHGYRTINFNNAWRDPTYTREVLTYDLLERYMPSPRNAFARVYLNGSFWGVYIIAEQINKDFLEKHFEDASGVRFKGDRPSGTGLNTSTFEYFSSGYTNRYILKTSHTTAWTQLGNMIAKLDNGPTASLEKDISSVINVGEKSVVVDVATVGSITVDKSSSLLVEQIKDQETPRWEGC